MNRDPQAPDRIRRPTGDPDLDRAVAQLSDELDPPRDLWPGIEQRLTARDEERAEDPTPASGSGFGTWAGLAMAAGLTVALLGLGSIFRPALPGGPGGAPAGGTVAAGGDGYEVPGTGALDRSLMAALERRRQQLGPDTANSLEADIVRLGGAVSDLLRALANKPDDPALHRHLAARQHQQAELLTRLSQL